MATERQLAANRRNAALSTGPKTDQGKALARRNALKHGLLANALLVEEDNESRQGFYADLFDDYQPVGAREEALAGQIVHAHLRLARATDLETGLLAAMTVKPLYETLGYWRQMGVSQEKFNAFDARLLAFEALPTFDLGKGFLCHAQRNDPFALLLRYRQQIERELTRAREELHRLQEARRAQAAQDAEDAADLTEVCDETNPIDETPPRPRAIERDELPPPTQQTVDETNPIPPPAPPRRHTGHAVVRPQPVKVGWSPWGEGVTCPPQKR